MGAFLLVAAAAVFVAVQWDQLGERVKLGILAALTGGFLLAGRRFRTALPATAGVLYHLGAFLIPANVAAVALHLHFDGPQFLLLEGVTAVVAWATLDRVEQSRVLEVATAAAVVVTAAGLGAVTGWPTALLLAAAAAGAQAFRRHGVAIAWALVAGLAPVLALAADAFPLGGRDALHALGLAGTAPERAALLSGALSAVVLGLNAARRRDPVLVVLAAAAAGLGAAGTWVSSHLDPTGHLLGFAAVFLILEGLAHAVRRDPFWAPPARVAAAVAEVLTAIASPFALTVGWLVATTAVRGRAVDPAVPSGAPAALAAALVGVAWVIADLRRRAGDTGGLGLTLLVGAGWLPTSVLGPMAVLTAVALGTASIPALAVTSVVLAAVLVVSGRDGAHGVAAVLVLPAPLLAAPDTGLVGGVALVGALVLAGAAVVRARLGDPERNAPLAWVTACAALLPLGTAWALVRSGWSIASVGSPRRGPVAVPTVGAMAAAVAFALAATAIAIVLDRGAVAPDVEHLGAIGRLAAVGSLALIAGEPAVEVAVVAAVVVALAGIDALRQRDPLPLYALPVGLPVLVATSALAAGATTPQTGLVLALLAAVSAGIAALVPPRWATPVLATMVAAGLAALVASYGDLAAFSTTLLVLGAIGAGASVVRRSVIGGIGAGVVVTVGIWGHLVDAGTMALDAYLAPVALGLLLAGLRARASSTRVSSWVAYGPAVVVLGGSALLERVVGGGGVHAVVAGTVAVAALLAGGARRQAGPLLLGTVLLVALTLHESLDVTRAVPTWGWLALGGAILLGAGVAMERLDTTPIESGRRLVDVVHERFT